MKIEWKTCLKVGVSLLILYIVISFVDEGYSFVKSVLEAAMPLIIGCAMAYFINIPMMFIERKFFKDTANTKLQKAKRPISLVLALLFMITVLMLIFRLVIPELIQCVELIIAELPKAFNSVLAYLQKREFLNEGIILKLQEIDWSQALKNVFSFLKSGISGAMGVAIKAISSTVSVLVNVGIGLIFAIYILLSKEKLRVQLHRVNAHFFHERWRVKSRYVLDVLDESFHSFIVGQCTEAVILGVLCMTGMMLLRLPYATMIGAFVGFTALIPIVGAFIGAGVGIFMIISVDPMKALIFLVFFLVLQQIEGNVIYPKVVGSSMGLPGMWVLASVTVGGGVFGIPGMLIGVPLCAAIYRLLKNEVNNVSPLKGKTEAIE